MDPTVELVHQAQARASCRLILTTTLSQNRRHDHFSRTVLLAPTPACSVNSPPAQQPEGPCASAISLSFYAALHRSQVSCWDSKSKLPPPAERPGPLASPPLSSFPFSQSSLPGVWLHWLLPSCSWKHAMSHLRPLDLLPYEPEALVPQAVSLGLWHRSDSCPQHFLEGLPSATRVLPYFFSS